MYEKFNIIRLFYNILMQVETIISVFWCFFHKNIPFIVQILLKLRGIQIENIKTGMHLK